jgi:hypothetical protein
MGGLSDDAIVGLGITSAPGSAGIEGDRADHAEADQVEGSRDIVFIVTHWRANRSSQTAWLKHQFNRLLII